MLKSFKNVSGGNGHNLKHKEVSSAESYKNGCSYWSNAVKKIFLIYFLYNIKKFKYNQSILYNK